MSATTATKDFDLDLTRLATLGDGMFAGLD